MHHKDASGSSEFETVLYTFRRIEVSQQQTGCRQNHQTQTRLCHSLDAVMLEEINVLALNIFVHFLYISFPWIVPSLLVPHLMGLEQESIGTMLSRVYVL